jgi:hypothetical protein
MITEKSAAAWASGLWRRRREWLERFAFADPVPFVRFSPSRWWAWDFAFAFGAAAGRGGAAGVVTVVGAGIGIDIVVVAAAGTVVVEVGAGAAVVVVVDATGVVVVTVVVVVGVDAPEATPATRQSAASSTVNETVASVSGWRQRASILYPMTRRKDETFPPRA